MHGALAAFQLFTVCDASIRNKEVDAIMFQ